MNTILTLQSNELDYIDDEKRAVKFLQELLWAEANRVGIPLGDINISLKTKVADGGIDASAIISVGFPISSSIFADKHNAYQVKAGESFKPWQKAAIRKELFGKKKPDRENLNSMIKDCLDQNGRYVLVCFGHDLTDRQRRRAIAYIETFLSKVCKYENPKVEVWSRNNLEGFAKMFPSLILSLRHGIRNFQTHQGWGKDKNMLLTFIPGENQSHQIRAMQDALRQDTFHIRVVGEPGIGKTRLVFEATKEDDLSPLVIYCYADDFWGSALMTEIIREDNVSYMILVVDECSPEKRAQISNKLKGYSDRIRLISIHTDYDNASDVSYLDVPPLDETKISKIIQEYKIPEDQANKWSSVCGGSPRVAHVVGQNLLNNPNDMLREPDTERVWDRYIEGGDDSSSISVQQRRLVLMYLSLFKRFGFGNYVRDEAESIHKLIEEHDPAITWGQFTKIIKELRRRRILQGETTLYITPKLLHIKLWIDWWETYGSMFTGEMLTYFSQSSLIDWFFEMFEYASGSEVASQTARKLLDQDELFQSHPDLLKTARGARFFRYLGEVEPVAAVKCLQKTIGRWDKETLLEFSIGRREIIWLLEKTAQWRNLFSPSAKLLLALAEAENETWLNNASGVFAELFSISRHPKLSPTEAAPIERFPILEEALQSDSGERRNLALDACNRALSERTFGTVSNQLQVFGGEPDYWTPSSWGELFGAYRQVWKLVLETIDDLPTQDQEKASDILIQHVRNLGVIPDLADMIASDMSSLASKSYVDDRKIIKAVNQLLHSRKDVPPEIREKWVHVNNKLLDDDYHSSMKRYVSMNLIEDHFDDTGNRTKRLQTKIQELAGESFNQLELFRKELPWLVTTEASNGYWFGYYLAQNDKDFSLIPQLIDAQKKAKENATLYFLGGYLRTLFEENALAWEDLMDELAQEPETSIWIFELTQRTGQLTKRGVKRILSVLQENQIDLWLVQSFMYGGVFNNLPKEAFNELVEFLISHTAPSAPYIALGLFSSFYIREGTTKSLPEELTLQLLTNEAFSEIPEGFRQGNNRVMAPYHWKLIADTYISSYPDNSLKISASALEYFNNYETIHDDSAPRSVLRAIVAKYPKEVWEQMISYLGVSFAEKLTHWLRGDDFFGQPREEDEPVLPLIPKDIVWQWVEDDVEKRAPYLARFIPPVLDPDSTHLSWMRELLIRYGRLEEVRGNLWSNYSTEGWMGNESEHLERKKQKLFSLRHNETNENVKQWLDDYIDSLEKRTMHVRIEEERRDYL